MKNTGIQWSHDTVNCTTGCDGCELWIPGKGGPCYAGHLHETRLSKTLPALYAPSFTETKLAPGRMAKIANCMDMAGKPVPKKPWLDGHRRMIFVGDMGDIFSKGVPFDYLESELANVAKSKAGSRHDWLCLTKQPARALQFADWLGYWPDNIWLGTSITGVASLKRLDRLVEHPARIRFVSLEPQIEDVDISPWLDRVNWVIPGGESDQTPHVGREFRIEWARKTLAACRESGVKYFLKQLGSNPTLEGQVYPVKDHHGGDWTEWPEDIRIREVPT